MRLLKPKRGISIIEVLFAIGVVAVGLLGLTAVLPVALHQVGRGYVADTGGRLANNAAEDFDVRGMRTTGRWRYADATAVDFSVSGMYFQAFAIDPQFIIMNSGISSTSFKQNLFPYNARALSSDPRMARVTLLSDYSALAAGTLTHAQADMIFTWDNELQFEVPEEHTATPKAVFDGGKREFEGRFSWMATVAPKLEGLGFQKDLYTLSIVVFHRRDPSYAMFIDADADRTHDNGEVPTLNENVVFINNGTAPQWLDTSFHGDGYHGGDVSLQASAAEELDIKEGNWLLLMGNANFSGTHVPTFRWYRVLSADSGPELVTINNNPIYKLDVTIHGADWPYKFLVQSTTQVAVVKHIVAVHEKTIRLESSSLW